MGYLEEFQSRIAISDYPTFLVLWEEYCTGDEVDGQELIDILQLFKESPFAHSFGQYAETALPLWKALSDKKFSYDVLRLIIDLQTANSPAFADLALEALKEKYPNHIHFNEYLRLVGLRNRDNFQGALTNYDLLAHMDKGKFVFHTAGWGTGEIVDISLVREQLTLELDTVAGRRDLSFANAFKNLIPLSNNHFLARRFGDPDGLEKEARENPSQILKLLLRDLGPQTAAQIKDELCDLVIPEDDWTKWWQSARAKIKKDPLVESPSSLRDPFKLRSAAVSQEERFQSALEKKDDIDGTFLSIHNTLRDFPELLKNQTIKESLKKKLLEMLSSKELTSAQTLQVQLFLEDIAPEELNQPISKSLQNMGKIEDVIQAITVSAFKKRVLVALREGFKDWTPIFLQLLLTLPQNTLRDYILKELDHPESSGLLRARLEELLEHPTKYPETFVWYFQKVANKEQVPLNDKDHHCRFFEAFLMLFHYVEQHQKHRDLTKKMYSVLCGDRYAVVRSMLEGTPLDFVKEFLLLVSKCHSFTDHDAKILRALAEVVHPSLAKERKAKGGSKEEEAEEDIIWTTQEGFNKAQTHIQHIATVETVENAREIEAARALGDLRENSEFKFALEKRSRLQAELKLHSNQLQRARVITKDDLSLNEVGIGSIVDIISSKGKKICYTLLGPWDADTEKNILSFQSKFAKEMVGHKVGDKFSFQGEEYTITGLGNYFTAPPG